jgi:superfamily I DNA and RNA helicase
MANRLKDAQRYLIAKHPGAEQILIGSIDSWTGLERDIVLCPLVAGQNLGFLTTRSRVCTAFTRSRIGFTFIGNLGAMRQNRDFAKSALGTLIEELVEKRMFYTSHLTTPPKGLMAYMPSDEDVIASKGSGLKCFRCNGYGHKRADCKVKLW